MLPQSGEYIVVRAMVQERLGHFAAAAEGYATAMGLLKAQGRPIFECLFNRGYCNRWVGGRGPRCVRVCVCV